MDFKLGYDKQLFWASFILTIKQNLDLLFLFFFFFFFFSPFNLILLTILLVDRFYKHICFVASWISETWDQWRNSSLRDSSSKESKSYVEKKTHEELESYLRTKSILLLVSKPLLLEWSLLFFRSTFFLICSSSPNM